MMEVCPYLEETFKILGRSWNGLIINYPQDVMTVQHTFPI